MINFLKLFSTFDRHCIVELFGSFNKPILQNDIEKHFVEIYMTLIESQPLKISRFLLTKLIPLYLFLNNSPFD